MQTSKFQAAAPGVVQDEWEEKDEIKTINFEQKFNKKYTRIYIISLKI